MDWIYTWLYMAFMSYKVMVEMVFASESKRSMVGNVECVEQRPR